MEWPQWGQMPRPCVLLDAFSPLEVITPTLLRIQERSDSDLEGASATPRPSDAGAAEDDDTKWNRIEY